MLSPVALATWISFCTPWAEPRLLSALVAAGSEGEPFLVADAGGTTRVGRTLAEGIGHWRALQPKGEAYVGLTQIPVSRLASLGIHPETALDICANLEIGYHLLTSSYEMATKVEKSPWKTISVTYAIYRTNQPSIDSPYARKATDHLMKARPAAPAPLGSPLRHAIMAEWSAGLAMRQAARHQAPLPSPLTEASRIAVWARGQY